MNTKRGLAGLGFVFCAQALALACNEDPVPHEVQDAGPDAATGDAGPDATEGGDGARADTGAGADAESPADAGPLVDAADLPPDAPLADAGPLPDLPDAAGPQCEPSPGGDDPPPATLENAQPLPAIDLGGPVGADQLVLANLDGDAEGTLEVALVRGGRVEARRTDGQLLWQSAPYGARLMGDAVDLNGDGRLEVVARATKDVRVFDAVNGELRFRLPPMALGPERNELLGIHRIITADLDGDTLPELLVGDSGCGSGDGTAASAIFGFAGARAGEDGVWGDVGTVSVIPSPSRCARYHTAADLDADGRPELVLQTRTGLSVVDPLTGNPVACLEGHPELAQTLGVSVRDLDPPAEGGAPEIVVATRNALLAVAWTDEPAPEPCPAGTLGLRVRWSAPFPGLRADSVTFLTDAQGTAVAASQFDAETAAWRTVVHAPADGQPRVQVADLLLAGGAEADGDPDTADTLGYSGQSATPALPGTVRALTWQDGVLLERWRLPDAAPFPARRSSSTAAQSPDFRQIASVGDRVLLVRYDPETIAAERLESVGQDGAGHSFALQGDPGTADAFCDENGCRALVTLGDGAAGLFDPAMNLLNAGPDGRTPVLRAPAGTAGLTAVETPEGAAILAVNGPTLGRLEPGSGPAAFAWRHVLGGGTPSRPVPLAVPGTAGLVARRDFRRAGTVAWGFFDVETGERVWTHELDANRFRSTAEAVALDVNGDNREDLLRLDTDTMTLEADPGCPAEPVHPRLITALDATSQEVIWQTVVRPNNPCRGTVGTERLSLVPLGGATALLLTETDAVRRFDVADGREVDREVLDPLAGSIRGGGAVLGTGLDAPAVLRVGGNGPIEARDAELNLVWRADEALAPGNRSWLDRPALVVGRRVWIQPAPGVPAVMLGLDGPTAGQVEGTIRLGGGRALPEEELVTIDLGAWVPATNLSEDVARGVLVTGDDGWLYALDEAGALVFARPYEAVPGRPIVADVDADAVEELVVAVSNGTAVVSDNLGLGPIAAAWDLPCPAEPVCLELEPDHDVTAVRDRLCAEWVPRAEAEGYLVRVVGPNGAEISPWRDVGGRSWTEISDLELLPGALYCVEVRAWRQPGAQIELSPPVTTDCVLVVDETPPEVTLTLSADTFTLGDPPVEMVLTAHDEEGLAGWRIELWTSFDVPLGVLYRGQAHGQDWAVTRLFTGYDATGKLIPPGAAYELRAFAQDIPGAEAEAREVLTIAP